MQCSILGVEDKLLNFQGHVLVWSIRCWAGGYKVSFALASTWSGNGGGVNPDHIVTIYTRGVLSTCRAHSTYYCLHKRSLHWTDPKLMFETIRLSEMNIKYKPVLKTNLPKWRQSWTIIPCPVSQFIRFPSIVHPFSRYTRRWKWEEKLGPINYSSTSLTSIIQHPSQGVAAEVKTKENANFPPVAGFGANWLSSEGS